MELIGVDVPDKATAEFIYDKMNEKFSDVDRPSMVSSKIKHKQTTIKYVYIFFKLKLLTFCRTDDSGVYKTGANGVYVTVPKTSPGQIQNISREVASKVGSTASNVAEKVSNTLSQQAGAEKVGLIIAGGEGPRNGGTNLAMIGLKNTVFSGLITGLVELAQSLYLYRGNINNNKMEITKRVAKETAKGGATGAIITLGALAASEAVYSSNAIISSVGKAAIGNANIIAAFGVFAVSAVTTYLDWRKSKQSKSELFQRISVIGASQLIGVPGSAIGIMVGGKYFFKLKYDNLLKLGFLFGPGGLAVLTALLGGIIFSYFGASLVTRFFIWIRDNEINEKLRVDSCKLLGLPPYLSGTKKHIWKHTKKAVDDRYKQIILLVAEDKVNAEYKESAKSLVQMLNNAREYLKEEGNVGVQQTKYLTDR